MNGITVVIPTIIPKRTHMLSEAINSVVMQTEPPDGILVVADTTRGGASETRSRGLNLVSTEWTAFLDDDDLMGPDHLAKLYAHAMLTGADMVFPWFTVEGGIDPFPMNEHKEFDLADPHQTTVTFLVRTEAAKAVGGFSYDADVDPIDPGTDVDGNRAGEEFRCVIRLARAGYKIAHLDERTWVWRHHGKNTMGLPSRV